MLRKLFYLLTLSLSTGLMAMEQESNGSETFTTESNNNNFFGDEESFATNQNALQMAIETGDQDLIDSILRNKELFDSEVEKSHQNSPQDKSEKEEINYNNQDSKSEKSENLAVGFEIQPALNVKEQAKKEFEDSLEKIYKLKNSSNIKEKAKAVVDNFVAYEFFRRINNNEDPTDVTLECIRSDLFGFWKETIFEKLSYKELIPWGYLSEEDFKALNRYALEHDTSNREQKLNRITLIQFLVSMDKLDPRVKNQNGENLLAIALRSSNAILKNLVKQGHEDSKSSFEKTLSHMPWRTCIMLLTVIYFIRKIYLLESNIESVLQKLGQNLNKIETNGNSKVKSIWDLIFSTLNSPHQKISLQEVNSAHVSFEILPLIEKMIDERLKQILKNLTSSCNIV